MKKTAIFLILAFIAIQFIPTKKTNPPIDEAINLKASTKVTNILKRACYDCHSHETKWPNYSNIAPISWSVIGHVNDGRKAFNFSTWEKIPKEIKTKRLKRAIKTINNGMMPLPSYVKFHDEAILSDRDKKTLVDWCNEELSR